MAKLPINDVLAANLSYFMRDSSYPTQAALASKSAALTLHEPGKRYGA